MNKKGHTALGALAGSCIAFAPLPYPTGFTGLAARTLVIAVTIVAALLPDADHKTSTVSQKIQFSAKRRKWLRQTGSILLILGILAWLVGWQEWLPEQASFFEKTGPFVAGAGLLFILLAHLRTLVFSVVGILLLYAYHVYDWHWIAAFAGAAFLILPAVQHRGIIHTPEFAAALTLGFWSFAGTEVWWIQALSLGLITGWWAHLAGDIFGSDGIHSLFAPKIGVALHWFSNGGKAENRISAVCWLGSFVLWGLTLQQWIFS